MPVVWAFLTLLAGAVFVVLAYHWTQRKQIEEPFVARPKMIGGYQVSEEHIVMGTEGSGNNEVELYKYRMTIRGILPRWLAFGWSQPYGNRRRVIEDRNTLWAQVLFGDYFLAMVPNDASIHSSDGDLVFESGIRRTRSSSPTLTQLAMGYLERNPDLLAEVAKLALSGSGRERIVATRVLAQSFKDEAVTAEALSVARDADDPELRVIAAAIDRDRERLRAFAEAGNDAARIEAIRTLIDMRDDEGLVLLTGHPVPPPVAAAYLEVLLRVRDPRSEAAALRYLDTTAKAAAIDVLAAVGTRDSVEKLKLLLDRGRIAEDEKIGIEIAIELIQDRIKGRIGQNRGAISIAGERDTAGALSEAPHGGGELSDPE